MPETAKSQPPLWSQPSLMVSTTISILSLKPLQNSTKFDTGLEELTL